MKRILLVALLLFSIAGCRTVPTSWTTSEEEKVMVMHATIEAEETLRRVESDQLTKEQLIENLKEDVKWHRAIEQVITGRDE